MKLFLLLSILSIKLFAQNNDLITELVNNTEVAIYKSQKEMIRSNDFSLSEKLSDAIKLQVLAVKEYSDNKLELSADYSIQARELCIEILNQFQIRGIKTYKLSESEKEFSKHFNANKSSVIVDEQSIKTFDKLKASYKLNLN